MVNPNINSYIEKNKDRFLNELFELLRIPSVSADPKYKDDVVKTAAVIKEKLVAAGAEKVEICETAGYPIVYGEKIIDKNLPTILVYGHYDVQPADPIELWTSGPFEPVIKDGKIYARGACDDKGQMYMHVKAFELMMQTNSLPCNIKFMIEGEEEVGSSNLATFVKQNKEKLKADVIVISDTGIIANDIPSITVGLRGLSYVEVEVTGPNRDLPSSPAGELRAAGPAGGARTVYPPGAGRRRSQRRVRTALGVLYPQPAVDAGNRNAGAQVAPAGRAG